MTVNNERGGPTEPLESVTTFFGTLMIIAALAGAGFLVFGSGAYGGLPSVCATQWGKWSSSAWNVPGSVAARPGNLLSVLGTLQACADRPTHGEWALYIVAGLPAILFWAGLLFLLWRMMVTARRSGLFTSRVAAALRRLGWYIILGAASAAIVHLISTDALLATMTDAGQPYANLIAVPLHLPVPVLTGAALLTFARIVRVGAAMDAEIQATI